MTPFLVLALVLSACAHGLKKSAELDKAPAEMTQKIESVKMEDLSATPSGAIAASRPAAPGQTKAETLKLKRSQDQADREAARKAAKVAKGGKPMKPEYSWTPKAWPFGIGEKQTFTLRWGVVEGGVASIEVSEPQVVDGVPVLHYIGRVQSSKALDLFYKVDDMVQSWVRIKDHLPQRQEIDQLESAQWGKRVVVYNPEKHVAKFYSNTTFKKNDRKEEIRRDITMTYLAQDIVGAAYFFRFVDNLNGLNFPIHDRYKNWANALEFLGKERITIPAGEFAAEKYKMNPRVEGTWKPQGDVIVWLKDDPTHMVLQFKAKVRIGSITGEMSEFRPGRPINLPVPVMKTPINLQITGDIVRGFKVRSGNEVRAR